MVVCCGNSLHLVSDWPLKVPKLEQNTVSNALSFPRADHLAPTQIRFSLQPFLYATALFLASNTPGTALGELESE